MFTEPWQGQGDQGTTLARPPSPKSLLREPQAFPAASSTTPRGQNHSPGGRSPELWVEAKEDPLSEQEFVQGGPGRACLKEEGRKEAGKEEKKARTRLPETLPRQDLRTPWRAGSTLPAQQGWLGSLAWQSLCEGPPRSPPVGLAGQEIPLAPGPWVPHMCRVLSSRL